MQTGDSEVLGATSVPAPATRVGGDKFYSEIPDTVRSAVNLMELSLSNF
jgi:hypothetical protein